MWDFLKKLKKTEPAQSQEIAAPAEKAVRAADPINDPANRAQLPQPPLPPAKSTAQKTDEDLAEELNKMSPEILSQAKTPQMRKMVIDLYRKMLVAGVDVEDEKEVKKWIRKHPEAANGGEVRKIETVKRAGPKVGRNDPCTCGSGKKHKKCCGADGF
jgi:hypothetical protein